MGRFVRDRRVQAEPGEQHEIQPHAQTFLKFQIAQAMPLAQQKASEQDHRIITLQTKAGAFQAALQESRYPPPVNQRIDLAKHILFANPPPAFIVEQIHRTIPNNPPELYPFTETDGILGIVQRSYSRAGADTEHLRRRAALMTGSDVAADPLPKVHRVRFAHPSRPSGSESDKRSDRNLK